MTIELIQPEIIDVYRTPDRVKLRVREEGPWQAGGRGVVLELTFKTNEAAVEWLDKVRAAVEKPGPAVTR